MTTKLPRRSFFGLLCAPLVVSVGGSGVHSLGAGPVRERRFWTALTLAAAWLCAEFFRFGRRLRYAAFFAFALSFVLLSLTACRWSLEWYW